MFKINGASTLSVVLVNLISSQFLVRHQAPLAINTLAGYLKHQLPGLDVKTIDMQSIFDVRNKGEHLNKEESFKFAASYVVQKICSICQENQSIVGLSMKWTTRQVAQDIIDGVHKQIGKNKVLFVLGNIGSTFGYKELLSRPTFSNTLAVVSEGEDALSEVISVALEHQ